MDESRALSLAKQGDEEAKEWIVKKYERLIYKFIITYFNEKTMSSALKEDLFSCGVMAVLNAIKTYDEEKASFSTYVFIKVRKAIQVAIKNDRKGINNDLLSLDYEYEFELGDTYTLHDLVADATIDVESDVVSDSLKQDVWTIAKDVCSKREFQVIQLMSSFDMSYEECAKELNTTILAINGCRNKAIKKIRRYFA